MNSIEIYINNIGNNTDIYIDTKKHKVIINKKQKDITDEQIDELIRIIRTWDEVYESNTKIIDPEFFLINLNTNEETYTIRGDGGYPSNYHLFKEWIGELHG